MIEQKRKEVRDYKERFEFRLTVGDFIICQRYFRINNFNPVSLRSYDLVDTIRRCADMIDRDLKDKTAVYLDRCAPTIFNTLDEMNDFYSNEYNRSCMQLGYGIVVKDQEHDYFWSAEGPKESKFKFDSGEFSRSLTDDDRVDFKFAFCDNGREVCSAIWTGVYPKFIRNQIDLSNKKGRISKEEAILLYPEEYLLYKMSEGKSDLVYKIISEICAVCTENDNNELTTSYTFNNVVKGKIKNKKTYYNKPERVTKENN